MVSELLDKEEKEAVIRVLKKKVLGMRWVLENKEPKNREALESRVQKLESAMTKLGS